MAIRNLEYGDQITEAYVKIGMMLVLYRRIRAEGLENSERFRVIRPSNLDALEMVVDRCASNVSCESNVTPRSLIL